MEHCKHCGKLVMWSEAMNDFKQGWYAVAGPGYTNVCEGNLSDLRYAASGHGVD